ncbi:hypothetical protein E2C01_084891 [Portunus trituberculatus]|uniref:Uncharacterized protein n=1 Tax=Portunus trituberculatus TaxID=210409 RepID=A0A5B7J8Y8_PORTR|nr:hypothetical protein [Portunus trituberculatus]
MKSSHGKLEIQKQAGSPVHHLCQSQLTPSPPVTDQHQISIHSFGPPLISSATVITAFLSAPMNGIFNSPPVERLLQYVMKLYST